MQSVAAIPDDQKEQMTAFFRPLMLLLSKNVAQLLSGNYEEPDSDALLAALDGLDFTPATPAPVSPATPATPSPTVLEMANDFLPQNSLVRFRKAVCQRVLCDTFGTEPGETLMDCLPATLPQMDEDKLRPILHLLSELHLKEGEDVCYHLLWHHAFAS
jgi:hypothetical protein